MTEPIRRKVDANGVELNVYVLNPATAGPAKVPVVMLHGMRDVGMSLMPIATALAGERTVFIMDLRGHGHSDQPGSYAMAQYLFDLHTVISELVDGPAILFGHSLGGQIIARCAALYPELAAGAIIVEGLGPPAGRWPADPARALRMEGQRIQATLSVPERQRPLPSITFAADRLQANNPRLPADRALELARHGTEKNAAGELNWAFDPRVSAVFIGLGSDDSARHWPHVRCPTCIVSGALSAEYWGNAVPGDDDWDGAFAPGELEARVACFPAAEHVLLEHSGHMVHFDEPERLAEVSLAFLEKQP